MSNRFDVYDISLWNVTLRTKSVFIIAFCREKSGNGTTAAGYERRPSVPADKDAGGLVDKHGAFLI